MPHDIADAIFMDELADGLVGQGPYAAPVLGAGHDVNDAMSRDTELVPEGDDPFDEYGILREGREDEVLGTEAIRAEIERDKWTPERQQEAQEAQAAEYEQQFQSAVENFDKLNISEQREVVAEATLRGYDDTVASLDQRAISLMKADFSGWDIPSLNTPGDHTFPTVLGHWTNTVMNNIGDQQPASLEEAMALQHPAMAERFSRDFCIAIGKPELASQVDPLYGAAVFTYYAPRLFSGQPVPQDVKREMYRYVGRWLGEEVQDSPQLDALANRLVDPLSKWGTAARQAYLSRQEQRAAQAKSQRPSSIFQTNSDLFDTESEEIWNRHHGRV